MVEQTATTTFALSLSRDDARVVRVALGLLLDAEDDVQTIEALKRLLAEMPDRQPRPTGSPSGSDARGPNASVPRSAAT